LTSLRLSLFSVLFSTIFNVRPYLTRGGITHRSLAQRLGAQPSQPAIGNQKLLVTPLARLPSLPPG